MSALQTFCSDTATKCSFIHSFGSETASDAEDLKSNQINPHCSNTLLLMDFESIVCVEFQPDNVHCPMALQYYSFTKFKCQTHTNRFHSMTASFMSPVTNTCRISVGNNDDEFDLIDIKYKVYL